MAGMGLGTVMQPPTTIFLYAVAQFSNEEVRMLQ
jgi:hypothetical protein